MGVPPFGSPPSLAGFLFSMTGLKVIKDLKNSTLNLEFVSLSHNMMRSDGQIVVGYNNIRKGVSWFLNQNLKNDLLVLNKLFYSAESKTHVFCIPKNYKRTGIRVWDINCGISTDSFLAYPSALLFEIESQERLDEEKKEDISVRFDRSLSSLVYKTKEPEVQELVKKEINTFFMGKKDEDLSRAKRFNAIEDLFNIYRGMWMKEAFASRLIEEKEKMAEEEKTQFKRFGKQPNLLTQ